MSQFNPTSRTRIQRAPTRGVYDRDVVYSILDEALICHIGFVDNSQPYVIPTIHARIDDTLYIHGATSSRMLTVLKQGVPACLTVTLLDGLVLARSAFHHSMNYRSVVILGTMAEVIDQEKRSAVLTALVEHVVPGRSADARPPNAQELKATSLLSMPLAEVSAKVRTGPPVDDEEDYGLPVWAGVVPVPVTPAAPEPDPRLTAGIPVPDYVSGYRR